MAALRPFELEVTFTVVVVAESERDAEAVFSGARYDILNDGDPEVWASPLRVMPEGWSASIPYHDLDADHPRRDWTAAQWQEAAAEERAEAKRVAEFNARQVPLPLG